MGMCDSKPYLTSLIIADKLNNLYGFKLRKNGIYSRYHDTIISNLEELRKVLYDKGYSLVQASGGGFVKFYVCKLNCDILSNLDSLSGIKDIDFKCMRLCAEFMDIANFGKVGAGFVPKISSKVGSSNYSYINYMMFVTDGNRYIGNYNALFNTEDVLKGIVPCCTFSNGNYYIHNKKIYNCRTKGCECNCSYDCSNFKP